MKYVMMGMALLWHLGLFAQESSLDLTLKLKDMNGANMANVTITLVETNSKETVEMVTNAQGVAHVVVTSGRKYAINFLDVKDYSFVEVPENGDRTQSRGITYIPKAYRNTTQTFDRKGVAFKEVPQNYSSRTEPTKELSLLGLRVVNDLKDGLANIDLVVVSVQQKTQYTATTNGSGWAYFMVPMGQRYELDVPGIEAYKQYKLPESPFSVIEYSILFVPTNISEQAEGDTILQEFTSRDKPTSERIKMKVHVHTFEEAPLEGEDVFYDVQGSDEVYLARTDAQGDAYFLLPKNLVYMLNLTYERQIRPFSVESNKGSIGQGEMTVRYRGTDVIRSFYRTTRRNNEGIVIEFMETPVTVKEPLSVVKKTNPGFELNFDDYLVYSPLVQGEQLYSSHGFYSSLFSCFDAESGDVVWTTQLGESGASPALYHEGIVLMITESCSIYGIDAEKGTLAWSKWLAPYVICSPTAHDGLVYAVYQNDATLEKLSRNEYVLACFDIQDGSIKWQKWIDREGLASPVVAGNSVFITTLSGSLYEFDAQNGSELHKISMNAASAPTVLDDKIFIARRDGEHGQSMAVLNRKNWQYDMVAAAGNYLPGAFNRMNDMEFLIPYEGSRPLIHGELLYHTVDNVLYCRELNGKRVWQKGLGAAPQEPGFAFATMPIMVGDYIVVGTQSGLLLTFDAKSGKELNRIEAGASIMSQPVVMNGFIYAGTSDGRLVVFNTKDKEYDGWPMWGMDGSHNTLVK